METVNLMGSTAGDDLKSKKRQWKLVPNLFRRFRNVRKDSKWLATARRGQRHHVDQVTVAPSHSTMSRLDDSYDSRDVSKLYQLVTKDERIILDGADDEEDSFIEEELSFAQLNTEAPSAVYLAHADGMEVILKNGVFSDATVYSWSPAPGQTDQVKVPDESMMMPVEEISFFPGDDQYSTLIDQDQEETLFSSFGLDFNANNDAEGRKQSSEKYLDDELEDSFRNMMNLSSATEQNKPTAAMIKRMSVFTGEDLLTQEADTFAKQFLEDEKSKASAGLPNPPQVRSSESRLLAAINATDDDTISRDRSFLLLHQSLFDDNDDEDATISTVTGSHIYPAKLETIEPSAPEVSTTNYCGLFYSEPITTEADEDDDDCSDLYSRPSTTESSGYYVTRR